MAEHYRLCGEEEADWPAVEAFARCLAEGGVAVIPTDTVYGLACHAEARDAVERLYRIKGRPPDKPSAVLFFALPPALEALPHLGPRTGAALERLLPGPLTVLLPNPNRRFPLACEPQQVLAARAPLEPPPLLGLRVPALAPRLRSLATLQTAILQSSANRSGGREGARLEQLEAAVLEQVDLVLDGGALGGKASTVVDLGRFESDGKYRVVREGPLSERAVGALLDC